MPTESSPDPKPAGLDVPVDLIRRLSVQGPRYTSYPTANVFTDRFGPEDFAAALRRFGASDPARPLSLYVHLPFCRSLCFYCACNVVISREPGIAGRYLDALEHEVDTVARLLGPARRRVTQLHLGGGTPTYLSVAELERLYDMLAARFDIASAAELAVEIDPRVTSRAQLETLARRGFNRASFGVQDFDPTVQRAVNRVQPFEMTAQLIAAARLLGYRSLNLDLIYGLPYQQVATFAETLERVLEIRPDRIALYSYAHVPWIRRAQGSFDAHELPLPAPEEKIALFRMAVETLTAAGYRHLGMDHFALPQDELSRAQDTGMLHRNFQGYTVRRAEDLLGLGVSSISDLEGVYAQNEKDIGLYQASVSAGRLATVRGISLSDDDRRRRRAIMAIMCGGELPEGFARDFAPEIASLAPLEADGLLRRTAGGIEITPLGRIFIRNIAMAFDRYVGAAAGKAVFSKTV
jgi:oxygen-independent coproporphyrinogen-3 oxidase